MTNSQIAWVEKLYGPVQETQANNDELDARKTAILEKYRQALDANFDLVMEGYKVTVEVGKDGDRKSQPLSRGDLDARKMPDAKDDIRMAEAAWKKFETAQEFLKSIVAPVHDSGLFGDSELSAEVYDPLVRRGVPETFIGDKYSRTHKILEGSVEGYQELLAEEDLKFKVGGIHLEEWKSAAITLACSTVKVGNVVTAIDGATQLAASQQQFTGLSPIHIFQQNFGVEANDNSEFADGLQKTVQAAAFLQNVLDAAYDGTEIGLEAVDREKEAREQKNERSREPAEHEGDKHGEKHAGEKPLKAGPDDAAKALARSVIVVAAGNVGAALPSMRTAASSIFRKNIQTSAAAMGEVLTRQDVTGGDIATVIELLRAGIVTTLKKLLPDAHPDGGVKVAALTNKKDQIAKDLNDKNYVKVMKGFGDGLAGLRAELVEAIKRAGPDAEDRMKAAAQRFVDESVLEDGTQYPEHPDKTHQPDWVEDAGKHTCLRCAAVPGDSEKVKAFARLMDLKIAQLEKEAFWLNVAVSMGAMTFDVAANFAAPLAAGGGLLRMMKFMYAAVKHAIDFNNFRNDHLAMISAASPYSGAMKGFRNDAAKQALYQSTNAACEGLKIVGALVQCSPGVVVGIGLAQGATGAEAIASVVYELEKVYHLKQAWKAYRLYLDQPDNRRLGLIAMRDNPTLRKYAMAWGAVIERDPLVSDFMDHCGLNAENLKGKQNVAKVVEYLEARLPEDIRVVGRRYGLSDWAPETVELTADSWLDAKTRGETQGGIEVQDTGRLETALSQYESALEEFEKDDESKEKLDALHSAMGAVRAALTRYSPKSKKKDGSVQAMLDVCRMFMEQLNKKQREVPTDIGEERQAEGRALENEFIHGHDDPAVVDDSNGVQRALIDVFEKSIPKGDRNGNTQAMTDSITMLDSHAVEDQREFERIIEDQREEI